MEGSYKREKLKEIIKEKALIVIDDDLITLSSGIKSNFFFDMKTVLLSPEGANLIVEEMLEKLQNVQFDYIGGMESGSIPIIALICANSTKIGKIIEGFYVRKQEKIHGMRKSNISNKIEGNLKKGSSVVIVDDVATTGGSIIKAINEVEKLNCKVVKVITIVDRCQGAKERLAERNIEFDALFTKKDFGL